MGVIYFKPEVYKEQIKFNLTNFSFSVPVADVDEDEEEFGSGSGSGSGSGYNGNAYRGGKITFPTPTWKYQPVPTRRPNPGAIPQNPGGNTGSRPGSAAPRHVYTSLALVLPLCILLADLIGRLRC